MKYKGIKGNYHYSPQKGTRGHCFAAQVWSDVEERYVATINSTEDEETANKTAQLFAAAPEMLIALQNIENDNKSIPEPIWSMVQNVIKKAIG